jgi:hypothetical protein
MARRGHHAVVTTPAGAREMTPLYWALMITIITSSQILDALTTRYFLSKGGWREINPAMVEPSKSMASILKMKGVCIALLVGFLYAVSFGNLDMEKFLLLSYAIVITSVFVSILNPSIVLFYWIKDSACKSEQVKS